MVGLYKPPKVKAKDTYSATKNMQRIFSTPGRQTLPISGGEVTQPQLQANILTVGPAKTLICEATEASVKPK